jgi:hypothetical protein
MILLYTQRKQLTTLGQLLYFYAWDAVPGRLLLSRCVSSDASFPAHGHLELFCFPAGGRTSVLGWTPSGPSAECIMGRCRGCGFLVVVLFRRWAMSTVRRSARGVSVRKITPSRVCCIPSTFLGGWISTFEMSSSLLLIPFMACANSTSMSPFQHTPKMTPYTQMLLLVLAMRPGHPRPSLRASKLRRPSHGRRNHRDHHSSREVFHSLVR